MSHRAQFTRTARRVVCVGLAALLFILANGSGAADTESSAAPNDGTTKVGKGGSGGDTAAADQEWGLHGLTSNEARYSSLNSIRRDTVGDLSLAWSYATGTHRGLEATPLMVDGVLYGTASWSIVFALDARTGQELWRFDPEVPGWKARHACCDVVNRGVAYHEGRIFVGTIDGRLIALEAKTGEPVWSTQTADRAKPYTITGAPRIVKDLVVIGNGGADLGVRGYISAYHAETGELAWRFYTVPASKDGPHEHDSLQAAAATWSAKSMWETGLGGTAWDSMVFDPELNLLYVGTGNASIYDREKRSPGGGDNLYLASILALRPDTGELVWYYQTTPGEHWDYTATQHMILTELNWKGKTRKVLLQAPKNGFFYVLDRITGELLSAEKFVHVSWAERVDLETGRPVEREEALWSKKDAIVSPAPMGGHSWHPMSFHPGTGLVYIPAMENLHTYLPSETFRYRPGTWNTGEDFTRLAESIENYPAVREIPCGLTRLIAWDPLKGEKVWEVRHDSGVLGGTLATAGGLVFQGAGQGKFKAYDAATGAELWNIDVGIDVMAPPITYRLAGEQYITVLAGVGGSAGNHLNTFDHDNAGRVLTFKLGGTAEMPEVARRGPRAAPPAPLNVPPQTVAAGRKVYADNCAFCHGIGLKTSGLFPDLASASAEVHENWNAIVIGGIRSAKGMPSFADLLSAKDAQDVRTYVLEYAARTPGLLEQAVEAVAERICVPVSWLTD